MNEFIICYGQDVLLAILTAAAGYLGSRIKKIYEKYINDRTKKNIVTICVEAAEQIYSELGGDKKYEKARQNIIKILNEKGIKISETEIEMMIESTVSAFNHGFSKKELQEK